MHENSPPVCLCSYMPVFVYLPLGTLAHNNAAIMEFFLPSYSTKLSEHPVKDSDQGTSLADSVTHVLCPFSGAFSKQLRKGLFTSHVRLSLCRERGSHWKDFRESCH